MSLKHWLSLIPLEMRIPYTHKQAHIGGPPHERLKTPHRYHQYGSPQLTLMTCRLLVYTSGLQQPVRISLIPNECHQLNFLFITA